MELGRVKMDEEIARMTIPEMTVYFKNDISTRSGIPEDKFDITTFFLRDAGVDFILMVLDDEMWQTMDDWFDSLVPPNPASISVDVV